MRWERFFEDLQDQFDAEWEAERAVLDTEAERLRLSKVTLRERLLVVARTEASQRPDIVVELIGSESVHARITAVGVDWVGVEMAAGRSGIIPVAAISALQLPHADVLRSARPADTGRASVAERMGIGFVLRDLVRRRVPVTVATTDARTRSGTIDRAGVDHLDLALHEPGEPRRADSVRGHRIVPFSALAWVRVDGAGRE